MATKNKINLSVPGSTAITDGKGVLKQEWRLWFNKIYQRLGGDTAYSNTDLEDFINNINGQVDTINLTIATLQTQLNNVNDEIVIIQSNITTINDNILTIQNNITDIQNNITTINNQLYSLNQLINTINVPVISNNCLGILPTDTIKQVLQKIVDAIDCIDFTPADSSPVLNATNSSSISFTTSGTKNHNITAAVKKSATAGNVLELYADGLYVPTPAAKSPMFQ